MSAAQETPEFQPTFHDINVGMPLEELFDGHTRPSVSRLQIGLLQKYTNRYALMDGTDGPVFSSANPPQAETGQRNVAINGAHPFYTSVESQAHWKNATDIVGVKRTAERVSVAETEPVTALTPIFENGTPRLLDRIGRALNAVTKPALATGIALAPAAIVVSFDQKPSFNQEASPSAEPSPAVDPSLEPGASTEPTPLPTDPRTGLVICPSPSPEPTPSPTPIIIAVALPQAVESPAESAEPSITPEPETAVIDPCAPTASTEPSTSPSAEPTPAENLPSANEFIDSLLNQQLGENGTINKTSYKKVENRINALWDNYKDTLSNTSIPDYGGEKFTKEFLQHYLKLILKGSGDTQDKHYIRSERMGFAAGLSVDLIATTNSVADLQLKKDLFAMGDLVYDYAVWIDAFHNLDRSKEYVDSIVIAIAQASLDYTPVISK